MTSHRRWTADALRACVCDALVTHGVPTAIAKVEADIMVEADLLGVPSHGVAMLPRLLRGLRDGRCTGDPSMRLVRDRAAACLVDADNGPGRYVAARSMQHAVDRARQFGVGLCLAARTTHWGRAHAYASRAARQGMIGLCTTNAIPTMMVPGLAAPVLGNNPLALGVPRGPGRDPVVLDLAMSQAALGKVGTAAREGHHVPLDWGVDRNGQATDDPAAILASGILLPIGGHKGVGLAILMELITGALAGGLLSHEIVRRDASGLDPEATKLFLAIDVGAVADPAVFASRVDDMLGYLGGLHAADPTRFPGDRGWLTRDAYERDGIPIHPGIVAALAAAGVDLPADRAGGPQARVPGPGA